MKTIEVFDTKQFEPLRAIGADVDHIVKLAVAGKSITLPLYKVKLQDAKGAQVFETFVKEQFGSLKGLIEAEYSLYSSVPGRQVVKDWVRAGAFAEELRAYALTTGCHTHKATNQKTKSTCYGALHAYLEICDLTDPMVSKTQNICHLDAMIKRVTTREELIKFLDLLVQNRHARGVQERVLSKGFPNLDRHIAWYRITESMLYERNVKAFEAENPNLTLGLRSLGLEEAVGNMQADALTKALVDQVLVDHGFPPFGDRSKVSAEGLMAKYLDHLMTEVVSMLLPENKVAVWYRTANGMSFHSGRIRLDDMVTQVRVYSDKELMVTAKVSEFLMGRGDMTARLANARWAVGNAIRQALLSGKTEEIEVLSTGRFN